MPESYLHKKLKKRALRLATSRGYRVSKDECRAGKYGYYDVWGINESFGTIGIEVKISWGDFKGLVRKVEGGSLKHTSANENYVMCPAGMVNPNDVPDKVGLLWYYEERGSVIKQKDAYYINVPLGRKMTTMMDFLWSACELRL